MFINCRHCNALVATDPVTDLPPERCPRCKGVVREPAKDAAAADLASAPQATPVAPIPAAPPPAPAPEPPQVVAPVVESPDPAGAVVETESTAPAPAQPAAETELSPATTAPVETPAAPATEADADAPTAADTAADVAASAAATAATATAPERDAETMTPSADAVDEATEAVAPQVDEPPPADAADTDAAAPAASTSAEATPAAGVAAQTSPGFLSRAASVAPPAHGLRRWGPAVAIVALVLLLGLQAVIADRERLAADAQWRPLATSVCGLFGCSVPPWREPDAFVLLAREVRPHPGVDGALRVRASFRNDARWAQAMPRLLLSLSDVDGRTVAARAFEPGEYLAAPAAAALIEPGQTADIALDIREPSVATVSYAFDFR